MTKIRLFIDSSKTAKLLAEMLRDELRNESSYADIWKDIETQKAGQSKLQTLEELCKEYELIVVVLTKVDMDKISAKDIEQLSKEELRARDDRLFRTGLFMSGVGAKHCLLVSSVEKSDLPSDLDGITPFPFVEPKPELFISREACKEAIQVVAGDVRNLVDKLRRGEATSSGAKRPLKHHELLARERFYSQESGRLYEDNVVVAAVLPREPQFDWANRIRENIDLEVRYIYIVHGDIDAASKAPKMLQLLLLATKLDQANDTFARRQELVRKHKDEILKDLREICKQDKVNLYFIAEPLGIEYCIHNATHPEKATIYLKHREEYLEWEAGEWARSFWSRTREHQGANDPEPREAIFHAAKNFSLQEEPFFGRLQSEMMSQFPDIGKEVLELCLKGPQKDK